MRRIGGALSAGIVLYATAACGPETTQTEARITGFAYGIDSTIVQDEWVQHTGESSTPWRGEIRNKRHYTEFTGCREVDNSVQPEDVYEEPSEETYYSPYDDEPTDDGWDYDIEYGYGALFWPYDESDDSECWNDWCNSDDYTHCEAEYVDLYDYEQLEKITIKSCPAPVVITMDKPLQPAIDAACLKDKGELQRIEQISWLIVSVTVKNPFYDSEENPREMLQARLKVSEEAWDVLENGSNITVNVAEDQTVHLD
jgi:hypothetical protein